MREAVNYKIAREIDEALPTLSRGRGPIAKGVRTALRKARGLNKIHSLWDSKFARDLQSAICNGQGPNTRLFRAGLSDSKQCNLCIAEAGSLEHRHICPRTHDARGTCVSDRQCDRYIGLGRGTYCSRVRSSPTLM